MKNRCVEACTYRDTDMLNLFRREWIPSVYAEALHPYVGDAVYENERGLNEFGGRVFPGRRDVPGPSIF